MSAIHSGWLVMLLLVAPPPGPTPGQIDRWVEELGADDSDTWRKASERLWRAGRDAEPALRRAMKHRDADVVLRARLVLSRFEWGLYPNTPAAVVKLIERYRDGSPPERRRVVPELVKQGHIGYRTLQRLAARETDAPLRQFVADYLKQHTRPAIRDMLAAGDRAGAVDLLEATAATGSDEGIRDLAAFWVQTGQAATKARELERLAAGGNKQAARLCAYLHRGNGDLAAARRLAEKAGDEDLLAGILDEQEDYKALIGKLPRTIKDTPYRLATILHRAGETAAFEAALKRIAVGDSATRARVLFFNGRPREAIAEQRKSGALAQACQLLALQGRRREALAISREETRDQAQGIHLHLEQAVVYEQLGEREKAGKLLFGALAEVEKAPGNMDYLLGSVLGAATRTNRRKEVLAELARVLDRVKQPTLPRGLLFALSERDGSNMEFWWGFLRRRSPQAPPSAILGRLRRWFEEGKADRDFDLLLAEVQSGKNIPAQERERWPAVLARTCVVVGKEKQAEEVLRSAAKTGKSGTAYRQLADFYFERRRWSEAAAEYGRVLGLDRTDFLALYLRGAALIRAGQGKEGRALTEQARLLPLADEAARYNLAVGLIRHRLRDEANPEWLVMARTAPFGSIYTSNGVGYLAAWALRQKKPLEAARYYRRLVVNHAMGGGMFLDATSDLRVPARALQYQARGLLAEGQLGAALAEVKKALEYLPEDTSLVSELVRALDRAKRKPDADKLFEDVLGRHQKACVDFPKSADCHNRLAWLLVRSGRRLDQALRHARTATTLLPESAAYLDTLAEVLFQRGERDEAIAVMKRVVKLAPGQPYFAAQQKRIEAGNRDADLPEQ